MRLAKCQPFLYQGWGGGGSSQPFIGFSSITFDEHKLETLSFAESNFKKLYKGEYNQIQDFLQDLGGERGENLGKCKKMSKL